ncbi:MAG: nucleotide exchange factor GrpE [Halobacteriales archaeon]
MTDSNADADVEPGEESADVDPAADAGTAEAAAESVSTDPAHDELVARVAAHDEALAAEVADLAVRVAALEAELAEQTATTEELESKLKRARADFQNYKKRMKQRQEELRERATEDLVERLLDVRDNLVRALEQDEDADIRDGVEATLASFDRVLDDEDVSAIEPGPGEAVEPDRHEVVLREEDGDQPPGTIERVYRPGYELAGSVLRPAQVTVSEAPDDEDGAN